MYKILGLIFCFILVICCSPNSDFLGSLGKSHCVEIYFCTSKNLDLPYSKTIRNGAGFITCVDFNNARKVQNMIHNEDLQGIVARFDDNFDIEQYIKSVFAETIFCEEVDKYQFIYAYSPKFSRFVMYGGQKINIQIAKNSDFVTVGYPLILTGA